MEPKRILAIFLSIAALNVGWSLHSGEPSRKDVQQSADQLQHFPGRWDLTLKAPDREYGSWLEIRQEAGKLTARMVGRWGNARALPKVEIQGDQLIFVSPKEEEARPDDMVFRGKLTGETLSGSTTGPDGTPWQWSGKRAPALHRTAKPRWGEPVTLFNGKDMTGWKYDNPAAARLWTVEDGMLVSPGRGANIMTIPQFNDFKLHIEFNCAPKANGGIYLRGRYEVQIEDDSLQEPPSHRMGAVYGFLRPSPELPRTPGQWQSYDITLIGRMITVVQNGRTIINNEEIPGITGGALDSHEELPGPIFLQGDEDGRVTYRNIVITPARQ